MGARRRALRAIRPRVRDALLPPALQRALLRSAAAVVAAERALLRSRADREPVSQRLLRDCGVFIQALTIVNGAPRGAAAATMCRALLRLLPSLLWGSAHAHHDFARTIGFDQLLQLLLATSDGAPDERTVALLFNALAQHPADAPAGVGGGDDDEEDRSLIHI